MKLDYWMPHANMIFNSNIKRRAVVIFDIQIRPKRKKIMHLISRTKQIIGSRVHC